MIFDAVLREDRPILAALRRADNHRDKHIGCLAEAVGRPHDRRVAILVVDEVQRALTACGKELQGVFGLHPGEFVQVGRYIRVVFEVLE